MLLTQIALLYLQPQNIFDIYRLFFFETYGGIFNVIVIWANSNIRNWEALLISLIANSYSC